jgi:hypothetical protein
LKPWSTRFFILYIDGELEYYKLTQPSNQELLNFGESEFKGSFNISKIRYRVLNVKIIFIIIGYNS